MAVEIDRVLGKLDFIKKYLQKLQELKANNLSDYLNNSIQKDLSHLYLQVIFQAAIDINQHILLESFEANVEKYSETFTKMGDYALISQDLAKSLMESAKMRNLLVHLYDKIDYTILFSAIKKTLNDYPVYIGEITSYVDKLDVETIENS